MHHRRAASGTVLAVLAALVVATACGNGAVGVNACKAIEEARCREAPACGVVLQPPYSTSGTDVDACIRYYDVACLHGLSVADPGGASVDACVSAIESPDCTLVRLPESGACAWLAPPLPVVTVIDASSDDAEPDADDE